MNFVMYGAFKKVSYNKVIFAFHIFTQNGVAILYGNKESVYKQFREDAMDRKFSRKKAVTLFIQLKDKR